MVTKVINIASGVKINYIETDKFKTNYFSFNFITQMRRESAHLNALVPRILTHGSTNYLTQAEIDKRLQYLYSSSIAPRNYNLGKFQIFGISGDMLNDNYTLGTSVTDEMLDLAFDILFNPIIEDEAFSRNNTESEKLEIIDIINAEINNKGRYAQNRCTEIMCSDEIFSIKPFGTVDQVKSATAKQIFDAYKKALREYKIEIYFVGSLDIDKIATRFKACFDKIERAPEELAQIEIKRVAGELKEVTEVQSVAQGKLSMGFRTGKTIEDGDYHIAQLFSEIYGGSPSSKLFVNVREKKSLCYTCRSYVTQKSGLMYVSAGIEAENRQIAVDAILEQLENVKNAKITCEELDNAKKSLKNAYMNIYDSPAGMEVWTLNRELSNNHDSPLLEAKRASEATKEQIAEFARGITLDTIYFLKGEDANG